MKTQFLEEYPDFSDPRIKWRARNPDLRSAQRGMLTPALRKQAAKAIKRVRFLQKMQNDLDFPARLESVADALGLDGDERVKVAGHQDPGARSDLKRKLDEEIRRVMDDEFGAVIYELEKRLREKLPAILQGATAKLEQLCETFDVPYQPPEVVMSVQQVIDSDPHAFRWTGSEPERILEVWD